MSKFKLLFKIYYIIPVVFMKYIDVNFLMVDEILNISSRIKVTLHQNHDLFRAINSNLNQYIDT